MLRSFEIVKQPLHTERKMYEHKILFRYIGEMIGAFILYALVLIVSINVGRPMPDGIERTLILFSPMLPVLLMMLAVVRYFRRVDEYVRLKILENWAVTGGITAVWTFTYGFMENAGLPRLSMFTVLPIMGVTSALLVAVRRMLDR